MLKKSHTAFGITSLVGCAAAQGIIHVGGPSFTVTSIPPGSENWDIDNNGTTDASIFGSYYDNYGSNAEGTVFSFGAGILFARQGGLIASITDNASVGPANTAYQMVGDGFQIVNNGGVIGDNDFANIPQSGGTIGFSFQRDGQTHYGIAEAQWGLFGGGGTGVSFTISSWRWNDVPNQGILGDGQAGIIPEPQSVVFGLAALALGAAAVRMRRKSK